MNKILKNRYEILSILGRGGMGCVYKVADRSQAGRLLAAKELSAAKSMPEDKLREALTQFQTEARILARLTHPNLPKVFDYFSLGDRHYIIMEYIKGKTLEQILVTRKGRPVDEGLALSWALQICRAMHFLSVQRPRAIVFRDLKPSNIMITREGRVKLIDFGIARFFKENKSEDTYVYGTPGYAAPEQYGTGQTDVRSDIFSLGATLHHCLTGRNPSEDPLEFPDPLRLNRKLSREAAGIIKRALEPDMAKRFRNAREMKQAVQQVLLNSTARGKTAGKVINAQAGRPIKLPWWKKICWVSVPVMSLGCSGTTGSLSSDELWIQSRPRVFGPDTTRLLFRVNNSALRSGREYRPNLTIRTDAGVLRPSLVFKKSWPWFIIGAAMIMAIVVTAWVR